MALERERWCPSCEQDRSFRRTAATTLHLGVKTKWACDACDFGVVQIDDEVETATR